MSGQDHADGYNMGYEVGFEAGKAAALASFRTEWGVDSPWGTDAVLPAGLEPHVAATTMAANMTKAGHQAHVVWRGVTGWHKEES